MEEITLQALLEAGCHFGHKSERWHPKARSFIYAEKDGIHIIDLAKTKAGLEAAAIFVRDLVSRGEEILFVGTKRQAAGILKQEAEAVGLPYFTERWIGGFLTNWESVKKNIEKINSLTAEEAAGGWKKFPKHEQSKLSRYLTSLKRYYGGVLTFAAMPGALFLIDAKKEDTALREAQRVGIPVIAIVDTNSDPSAVSYVIPANDDAVGSIAYIVHVMSQAYKEGKLLAQKREKKEEKQVTAVHKEHEVLVVEKELLPADTKEVASKPQEVAKKKPNSAKALTGKRGRPKKIVSQAI